jgi:hypothetical protein
MRWISQITTGASAKEAMPASSVIHDQLNAKYRRCG